MVDYLLYFFDVLLNTVGCLIICGLVVAGFERLFVKLVGGTFGHKAIMTTAIIGTPVHEIGHAIMCLIFGHRITEMKLYEPDEQTGVLGYVSHTYNPRNWYQQFGNLFIGLGPIFSGLGVITAVLFLAFPDAKDTFFDSAFQMAENGDNVFSIMFSNMDLTFNMLREDNEWWIKLIGIVVIFSVIMHINLSPADIKGSIPGLLMYIVIAAIFSAVTFFIGDETVSVVSGGLRIFSAYAFALFTVIFICAITVLLIALIACIIKKIFVR